ncbi:MAG: sulfurtransferase TusA family protein [Candidatus Omnitrophica bacterium]|nr:sulfurtransferase TusA family protein [Candidatus Omnitrophota bacterium]
MSEEKFDKELNLKGTICPMNFVKAKLAIEDMEIGQILKLIIDFPTAKDDVPRGMEYEGQKVVRVKQLNDTDWEIVIRKEK